ncbi:MAG: sulfite reductase [Zetaproteobacteria bacterium]|nr:MAG: sulfite reductase [Zetaproteobacteria bacterium]
MSGFRFARSKDVEEFEAGYRAFRAGRMSEERFTPFRLQMGIYGQRQEGVQMVRIKLPGGVLTPEQMDVIGDCVADYAGRMPSDGSLNEAPEKLAHVTTRQDIQVNFVSLDDVPAFLKRLDAVGLTTREACGNTVRNVTSCFFAGRCPAEHADVSVHARAFAEYFLRHPLTQQFPRKFKVNFSGCAADCGLSGMHDIGFIACQRDGERGFQVWAAGGLSSQPMGALLLESFIPEREMLLVGEALMRMHFKYSDRKRRARARLKYVAQKLGAEGFVEEYRRQRAVIEKTHANDAPPADAHWRKPGASGAPASETGVLDQHDGRKAILLRLFRGDLTPAQCHAVAEAARAAGSATLRVTAEQGMIIVDVRPEDVTRVQEILRTAGLHSEYARGIADIVACPGTETCRLGITASRGLAEALKPVAEAMRQDPVLAGLSIKASGCQHSCGRHHVADLGFHGLAKKIDGRAVPHYQLHIGGSGRAGEPFAFATDPVPARHAPEAGRAVLEAYRRDRRADESVHDWAARIGREGINAILAPYVAREGDVDGLVYDWNENEAFSTKGNKKGECAGAVLSMTDALVSEAAYEMRLARAHIDAMFWPEAADSLRRSAIATARAFLVPYGEAPEHDDEVFATLLAKAADDAELARGFMAVQGALMGIDLADPAPGVTRLRDAQQAWLALAERRFAPVPEEQDAQPTPPPAERPAQPETADAEVPLLDLTGVACPMNFVKTKIRLAQLPLGARLDVILDDGAPIENVPLSLEEQGQKVLAKERHGEGQWKIRVEKCSDI